MADIAILMVGHVSVPVYPNISHENLLSIIEDCDPQLVFVGNVVDDRFLDLNDYQRPTVSLKNRIKPKPLEVCWQSIQDHFESFTDSPKRSNNELATIVYTSRDNFKT